ncbi:MAG: hypothetical protein JW929_06060 [Anaerolineales bacterium]|nr:hypothetical protein [Anaerolineales bacterium]
MGWIWETAGGFVKVDWTPRDAAPEVIDEEVDYDGDGLADFRVVWDTRSGDIALFPFADNVLYLEGKYQLRDAWAIRVWVKNPNR